MTYVHISIKCYHLQRKFYGSSLEANDPYDFVCMAPTQVPLHTPSCMLNQEKDGCQK